MIQNMLCTTIVLSQIIQMNSFQDHLWYLLLGKPNVVLKCVEQQDLFSDDKVAILSEFLTTGLFYTIKLQAILFRIG